MEQLLKLVYQPSDKSLSFFIKNASSNWIPISEYSELTEKKYKFANLNKDAKLILDAITKLYVHGNELRIILEGFEYVDDFCMTATKYKNIAVNTGKFTLAVLGKVKSGKTTLIEAFNVDDKKVIDEDRTSYVIDGNIWYEIRGIDLGEASYLATLNTIEGINREQQISIFIYCVEYKSGKIEDEEEKLIEKLLGQYPNARIIVAVTNSFDETGAKILAQKFSSQLPATSVIPILARKAETRIGDIQPYGVLKLSDVIYGG